MPMNAELFLYRQLISSVHPLLCVCRWRANHYRTKAVFSSSRLFCDLCTEPNTKRLLSDVLQFAEESWYLHSAVMNNYREKTRGGYRGHCHSRIMVSFGTTGRAGGAPVAPRGFSRVRSLSRLCPGKRNDQSAKVALLPGSARGKYTGNTQYSTWPAPCTHSIYSGEILI